MENDRSFPALRDAVVSPEPAQNPEAKSDSNEIQFVEYTGQKTVAQVRLPSDMKEALQHHALKHGWTLSKTIEYFCSSSDFCRKAHVTVTTGSIKRGPKAA